MKNFKSAIFSTAVIMCVILMFTMLSTSAQIIYGDVDADSNVSVMDATEIQRHIAKAITLSDDATKCADVDGDSSVSVMDATTIQRYVAKVIDKFPAVEGDDVTENKDNITKIDENITIHFSNNRKWKTVYAYVYDNETGTPMTAWPGVAMTDGTVNSYGETVYAMDVDCSKYDRIIFSNGTAQTTDTPLTVASSGYFIQTTDNGKFVAGVYPYGQDNEGEIKQVDLEYSKGYNKRITIWTPVGYDANDKTKKYSVLYMTDGQNLFGNDENCAKYEWEVDETVLSYMQNGGDGIIVVGIDNANAKRDSELTPDLGDVVPEYNYGGFKDGTGKAYSDFVVEKVIPYVEANYNTNSIRGIAGSSSGGIESFYIGMEHIDKFDYIGAISPAFLLYSKQTWDEYLEKFDFSDETKLPRIYFFNGNSPKDSLEQELYPFAIAMQGWMESKGYPSELLKTVVDNDARHNEMFWVLYFPEALAHGLGY